jgi:hypothetical protein
MMKTSANKGFHSRLQIMSLLDSEYVYKELLSSSREVVRITGSWESIYSEIDGWIEALQLLEERGRIRKKLGSQEKFAQEIELEQSIQAIKGRIARVARQANDLIVKWCESAIDILTRIKGNRSDSRPASGWGRFMRRILKRKNSIPMVKLVECMRRDSCYFADPLLNLESSSESSPYQPLSVFSRQDSRCCDMTTTAAQILDLQSFKVQVMTNVEDLERLAKDVSKRMVDKIKKDAKMEMGNLSSSSMSQSDAQ